MLKKYTAMLCGAAVTGALLVAMPTGALADTGIESEPERSISQQVTVDQKTIEVKQASSELELTLPGQLTDLKTPSLSGVPQSLVKDLSTPLVTTETKGAEISSFATSTGSQTLISIESAEASHKYAFPLKAPSATTASLEKDGSVSFTDSRGEYVGGIKTPWAYDANGKKVPTSFTLEDGKLIQNVAFSKDTAFPVTADPNTVWGWAKCIGTIGVEVLPLFVPGGKFAAAGVKLAAKFGSVKKGFEVMVRAWNTYHDWGKYTAYIKKTYGNVFADILGITALQSACFS
ncbi:hypothetical protein [Glutamicibacter sp. AOP5-A2-18]|uniref:hypothetical protein n=1 Tax=Glutamicibacter sp. AOP5-A2-18 TaxID=3457656 RepID=UPI0040336A12